MMELEMKKLAAHTVVHLMHACIMYVCILWRDEGWNTQERRENKTYPDTDLSTQYD